MTPSGESDISAIGTRLPARNDRGIVDDATIIKHLAPLRKARIWIPAETPAGVTDVRIHRVMIAGGRPAAVEIRAGRTK